MTEENDKKPDNTEQSDNPENKSRRDFLKNAGLLGAGVAAGSLALYFGERFQSKKSEDKVYLLTADNKVVKFEDGELKSVTAAGLEEQGRAGIAGRRWVMVTDLAKCRNARKCISACQNAHQLRPEQYHRNTFQIQDSQESAPYNFPTQCQHCDNPPCVSVCPVDATYKRNDGIVLIDNERCIGCRFCMAACPYSARIFNWLEPGDAEKYANQPYNVELNVPQKKGTVSKCLFSADRLRKGELPYCVSACPNGVFWFGDENEDTVTNGTTKETTRLSELLRDNGGFRFMEELGQKPRTYFLPPKNRTFPFPEKSIIKEEKS